MCGGTGLAAISALSMSTGALGQAAGACRSGGTELAAISGASGQAAGAADDEASFDIKRTR